MTGEELFLAIGQVEDSRLARSELEVQEPSLCLYKEEPQMQNKRVNIGRIVRNLIAAVIIISMLGVTAYAAVGYLIFESPQDMIGFIFGDQTGYDHKGVTTWTDPEKPGSLYENPAYDRVPVDEEVMESEVAPLVSPVGQSITWEGYTLRVDANMYDQVTKCGVLTYTLENPDGVGPYEVENNGKLWFPEGDIVSFSQYGYSYIIEDQTTDTKLTAAYYYQLRDQEGTDLELSFYQWAKISLTEYQQMLADTKEKLKQEVSEEEVIAYVKQLVGEDYAEMEANLSREEILASGYDSMAYEVLDDCSEKITIPEKALGEMSNITLAGGDITVSPIAMYIDITDMKDYPQGYNGVAIIRFKDGTEYVVRDEDTANYMFAVGSGDKDVTYMFNRIIDVNEISSIVLDGGIEIPAT